VAPGGAQAAARARVEPADVQAIYQAQADGVTDLARASCEAWSS
jgi:hypothetical protein